MAKDIKLDTTTHDLDMSRARLDMVENEDLVRQRLRVRLQTFFNEHFLFQGEGVPYMESVIVKNPDVGEITNIFAATITQTEGISRVVDINVEFDNQARTLSVEFEAEMDEDPPTVFRDTYELNLSGGEDLLLHNTDL